MKTRNSKATENQYENDHLKPKLSLCCPFLQGNENGDPPFLLVFFTRCGELYFEEKKSGDLYVKRHVKSNKGV